MAVYTIKHTQQLPVSLDTAWTFFSSPANLKEITPSYMGFHIHPDPDTSTKMYPGQIISYTVRPVFDLPVFWMTEITHVEEGTYFVDEQRVGPYTLWHHQHRFRAISGGVEMTDTVHYRLPFGWLGVLAHKTFVRRQLDSIFEFRRQALEQRFGKMPAA
ncbi:MAG: SRPBCC family protein [Saprospirales bacterium]|nr:SRPBCC family protein [Saprospirales bacterium]MBK8920204.1 SRPBCC family protein [Saprospirales bacterium]